MFNLTDWPTGDIPLLSLETRAYLCRQNVSNGSQSHKYHGRAVSLYKYHNIPQVDRCPIPPLCTVYCAAVMTFHW